MLTKQRYLKKLIQFIIVFFGHGFSDKTGRTVRLSYYHDHKKVYKIVPIIKLVNVFNISISNTF
jgi:hypothetical protein